MIKILDWQIMRIVLEAKGFTIGKRDPRVNMNYPGAFMVIEPHENSQLPTNDGSNGPWAIVGDNLPDLVKEAWLVVDDWS